MNRQRLLVVVLFIAICAAVFVWVIRDSCDAQHGTFVNYECVVPTPTPSPGRSR